MKTLTPSLEDYLEAIYILKGKKGFTRVSEIADFLNVKMPSVNSALKILVDKGFVSHENYGYVALTNEGEKEARKIYSRHLILKKFLTNILGVDENIAEEDACKLEHHISQESLEKLLNYIERILKKDVSFTG